MKAGKIVFLASARHWIMRWHEPMLVTCVLIVIADRRAEMDIDNRVKELATWYRERLHQDTRTNGDKFYKFCKFVSSDATVDDRLPKDEDERCTSLARTAHGDMLPDDWKYEFIREVLGAIEDAGDLDEIELEADIYNHDLCRWLGSHGERSGYCDEAQHEGYVSEDSDMITRIQMGQYAEKREVLGLVLQYLRDEAEGDDERESAEA
jgi:hypothetical protein